VYLFFRLREWRRSPSARPWDALGTAGLPALDRPRRHSSARAGPRIAVACLPEEELPYAILKEVSSR